jgi:16S rRNA (adenine1518-N6/adenine1519-N6)-dimethyltransferase
LGCDEKLFKRLVKTTFNQRRKTLRNNIKPLLSGLQAERGVAFDFTALLADQIMNLRPEQLSVEDFKNLTLRIQNIMHND